MASSACGCQFGPNLQLFEKPAPSLLLSCSQCRAQHPPTPTPAPRPPLQLLLAGLRGGDDASLYRRKHAFEQAMALHDSDGAQSALA